MVSSNGQGVDTDAEDVATVVIGGGQAGLAVGYHLKRRGLPFVILDANRRTGDSWRQRWDSLRLFTPTWANDLPGMPFPGRRRSYPTKDEVAGYLEAYAARFELPVHTDTRVGCVSRLDGRFLVEAVGRRFVADNVVVAMSGYQKVRIPRFADELDPAIVQLSSVEYRNPDQLPYGPVLVVGAHDTGTEIALENAEARPTWLSGRDPGQVPFRIDRLFGRRLGVPAVMFMFHRVMNVGNPLGRKVRDDVHRRAGPVVRIKKKDLAAAGVERVPRVVGARDGRPVLDDGRVLEPASVIWCTGFAPDFSWIELPVFADGSVEPIHERGQVPSEPGLYFVGLPFLSAASSALLLGVGRDADRIAAAIEIDRGLDSDG
jgi:putative flavoprotein involved in K+ transport